MIHIQRKKVKSIMYIPGNRVLNSCSRHQKNKQCMTLVLVNDLKNSNKLSNDMHTIRSWNTHSKEITLVCLGLMNL